MNGKFIFGVIIILLIGSVAFFMLQDNSKGILEEGVVEIKEDSEREELEAVESGNTYEVDIKNFAFVRTITRVMPGDTVIWTNKDSVEHSIIPIKGSFESELLAPGESYSYTFNDVGRFSYSCGVHPYMKGTIVVYKE